MPRSVDRSARSMVLVWALIRLPVVALFVYVLRNPILNLIEWQFDVLSITRFVIGVISTPVARLIWGVAFFGALLLALAGIRRLPRVMAYLATIFAAGAVMALLLDAAPISLRRGLFVLLILAVNLAPSPWFELLKRSRRTWNGLMLAGVGITELFFAREYWRWLRGRDRGSRDTAGPSSTRAAAIPGLVLASLAFAMLIRGDPLLALEQTIRMSADVTVLERGASFNGIALDPTGAHLFVTGHSLPHLQRYARQNLSASPLLSDLSTGGAQGFAYDPEAGEIYAFNTYTRQLLYFDATTLRATRILDVPNLSPGDPWLSVDPVTNTLILVSEADLRVGAPLIVLDRATGHALGHAELDAGNVLKHPTRPWLYLTFFRRRSQVLIYDLEKRAVIHAAPADPRAERMAFWKAQNELLVTSPMESRIMRFDADRLQLKGYISGLFGVRAIALDEVRQLLVCGNIATGHVGVIDLRTGSRLKTHYLGPWLRTIELHLESGTAYVSSNGALYALAYASPLRTGDLVER